MSSSVNAPYRARMKKQVTMNGSTSVTDSGVVLVRGAGVPFQPPLANLDPFTEWLSLMEVVQTLCPAWPVRDKPMLGTQWKL
jgi:hypothetical protein